MVDSNLTKEVNLGRVAVPNCSPPLPDFQCHPWEWFPKSTHLNGKPLILLSFLHPGSQHQWPHSLGPLFPELHSGGLCYLHSLVSGPVCLYGNDQPQIGLLSDTKSLKWLESTGYFTGNLSTTWTCIFPAVFAAPPFFLTNSLMECSGSLKHSYMA